MLYICRESIDPHTYRDLRKESTKSRRRDMLVNTGTQIIGHLKEVFIKEKIRRNESSYF